MNKYIDTIRVSRTMALNLMKGLSNEQLNQVPDGYSNNVIWNLAHLIAAQQGVCYKRAGLPLAVIDEPFFELYKPGTKPQQPVTEAEVEHIKHLAFSTLDKLEEDYNAGLFAHYIPWTTRYGAELSTIDDALQFLLFHEGMHIGYMMALKRMLAYQPA
jgi:hypothetical protein